MNQNRWTCLATLVLTTVIAPLATVHAKTLPAPAVGSVNNYSPLSPQSLPTTVTELETDTATPVVSQPVLPVSKLPAFVPLLGRNRTHVFSKHHQIARTSSLPAKNPDFESPVVHYRSIAPVTSVISQPQTIDRVPSQSHAFTSFTSQTASAPIPVVRSDKSKLANGQAAPTTVIINSTTAQAEVAPIQSAQDSQSSETDNTRTATATATTSTRPKMIPVPQQVAPIASQTNESHFEGLRERADTPSFEAVSPVFAFDNERPQQIVATAIAQVDDTVVAPESSIAIPVERPKQSTIPTQSLVTAPSIVNIEQPAATVQPALAKIVATQTGKASWYGNEAGSQTANGEKYHPNGLTAAHRTLPFGTKVRVTSIKTGRSTIVRINDRGPFSGNRIIDVSAGAAELIGIKNDGVGQVRVEILGSQG